MRPFSTRRPPPLLLPARRRGATPRECSGARVTGGRHLTATPQDRPRATGEAGAAELVCPESASAVRKPVHGKGISASAGARAVRYLAQLPIATTGTAALIMAVWKMRQYVSPYDACYLALARRLRAV